MKIVWQNVIFVLGFVAYNYFCFAKDSVKLGVFFDEDQIKTPINWMVFSNKSELVDILQPEPEIISSFDQLESANTFCDSISEDIGFSAVFGPKSPVNSGTLESLCSALNVPYILTSWRPRDAKNYHTTFNLYPEASLVSRALARIIKSLDWKDFVVLYENEESLIKLQDIVKIQGYDKDHEKNNMWLKELGPGPNYRSVLKEIKNTSMRRMVLDCETDKISEFLSQALEIGLIADISTNIFLTSFDAHTIDLTGFNKAANITTVRLFNPSKPEFIMKVKAFYPEIIPEHVSVDTALSYDAMLLFSEAMNALARENPNECYNSTAKECDSTYDDDLQIISQIHKTVIPETEAMTGEIRLENGQRTIFTLEVIETKGTSIAIWNSETPDDIKLLRNATETELQLQQRIQNHIFIVTTKTGPPYLAKADAGYEGYSKDLMDEISKILNMTYTFNVREKTPDILNDLILRQADLGICDFTITHQRREVIDFSMPFMSLGISILHRKGQEEQIDKMYAFMDPFSWTVWIYIVTFFLLISIVIFFIARLDPDDWENPHPCDPNPEELENIWGIKNCLWLTLGSIMTQGCDILPKGISSRIATAMWWFFSLLITSTYTANLAAFLTMKRKSEEIKSVEELANQNKIKYGLMEDGSTQAFFQFSNESLYQKMWNFMKNEKPSVFAESNGKGVERVLSNPKGHYAFFMESTQIEYEMAKHCQLRKIGQWLDSKSYGIGMPLNAVYRHQINTAILKLQETGKLNELKKRWWKEKTGKSCADEDSEEGNSDELTLANLGGIFVVLGVGIGIAFILAIIEFLWNVHSISVDEHMSYADALKVELKFACNITVTKKKAKPELSESSSSKSSSEGKSLGRSILAGAGSFLNVNTTFINKIGSTLHIDEE